MKKVIIQLFCIFLYYFVLTAICLYSFGMILMADNILLQLLSINIFVSTAYFAGWLVHKRELVEKSYSDIIPLMIIEEIFSFIFIFSEFLIIKMKQEQIVWKEHWSKYYE